MPVCECGLHLTCRMRVGMINDRHRHRKYMRTLDPYISKQSVCLNLSECSFLGHYLALKSAKKVIVFCIIYFSSSRNGKACISAWERLISWFLLQVYTYESNRIFQNVLQNVAKYNDIHEKLNITSMEEIKKAIQENKELVIVYYLTGEKSMWFRRAKFTSRGT